MHAQQKLYRWVLLLLHGTALYLLLMPSFSSADYISFAPSKFYYHYAEFDPQGNQPDKETGILYGFDVAVHAESSWHTHMEAGYSYHTAQIDYDGSTQGSNPQPVQTKTGTAIRRYYLTLGQSFGSRRYPTEIHLRLTHNSWDRNIKPKNNVIGLYEYYEWNEVGAGVNQTILVGYKKNLSLGIDVYRVTAPSVSADLNYYGAGTVKLPLQSKPGARIKLDWAIIKRRWFDYRLSVYYEYYSFGASDKKTVGPLNVTVNEPRSESQRLGVGFFLEKHF